MRLCPAWVGESVLTNRFDLPRTLLGRPLLPFPTAPPPLHDDRREETERQHRPALRQFTIQPTRLHSRLSQVGKSECGVAVLVLTFGERQVCEQSHHSAHLVDWRVHS